MRLIDQLPAFMATDDFFCRFVEIFAELAEATVAHADALPYLADVDVAPEGMVGYLAGWIGLDAIDDTLPLDRRRELVSRMGAVQAWRGTRRGLTGLLELATGGAAKVVDSGGIYLEGDAPANPKHVVVRVDTAGTVSDEHLVALIRQELPADCTFELWVAGNRVPASPAVARST